MMFQRFSVLSMVQLVTLGVSSGTPSCRLKSTHQESVYKDGDILIGGIMQRSLYNGLFSEALFIKSHPPWHCFSTATNLFVQFAGFISAIEEINRNPDILPNHTLGYQIFDSCSSVMKFLHSAMSILSNCRELMIPNYRCSKKGQFVGIVGDLSTETSQAIAQLVGMYRFPQVSFGALDPKLSDKIRYPSFYRTVPSEFSYFAGISHLLRHFGWTWVGILVSEDDSGEQAMKEIKKAVARSGGCVDFVCMVPTEIDIHQGFKMSMLFEALSKSTAHVFIINSSTATIENIFRYKVWISIMHKIWIASPAMNFLTSSNMHILNGSLMFSIKKGEMLGFQDFIYEVNPFKFPNDAFVAQIWPQKLNCNFTWHVPKNGSSLCLANKKFLSLDASNLRFVSSIYTAVYALAHALHALISSDQGSQNTTADWGLNEEDTSWKLNVFLKKTHFTTPAGDEFYFDNSGEPPAKYDILNNVNYNPGKRMNIKVGSFDPSAARHHQFLINDSAILWHSEGDMTQNLTSVCTQSCIPGYRKVPFENRPICCFACAPCSEGEFANSTDMENCMKCPDDQWPNMEKDGCIPRTIVFLSYSDPLGLILASAATISFLITAGALGIFIRHRDTPIVKANNQTLSYTLLISLMLTFLSSLLFIGRPAALTCLIQQAAFGIIFTVAVSCILAKTVIVVVAFKATKPGSRVGRWLGPRMSGSMVAMCTMGEVVICLSWLLISPPHPRADIVSETGKMILLCDHGLTTAFYIMIGYMGLLATVSFIVAFLARNLPDRFNEAKLITFSMLVFCSVWVSFIPAYLSTKGRYMVAVEIFAMLASSAGLLVCIFFPKCYIIFLRPDLNTRENITVKIHT